MQIRQGILIDDNVQLEGWIIRSMFKRVFIPFDLRCGFHSEILHRKDKGKVWFYTDNNALINA